MNDLATGADRLDLLRTFLRIVDAGSLSAAALQLAPPSRRSADACRHWSDSSACACCSAPPTACN